MKGRAAIHPITEPIQAERQAMARYYGTHPYFTRRPGNVVRRYIERFSLVGDTVLDPFGGSGVTAIEAMLSGRLAIQNDLNPFANFLANSTANMIMGSVTALSDGFQRVESACAEKLRYLDHATDSQVGEILRDLRPPKDILLPTTSDAVRFTDLFTPRQLAGLCLLKESIERSPDPPVRGALLLAWSATVAKLNRTFLSAKGRAESRGGASIFSLYRYKLADRVVELPLWGTFAGRFDNVLKAKQEVLREIQHLQNMRRGACVLNGRHALRILSVDAAELEACLGRESVDYVFTDPPYGGHIAYLDLSVIWNHWLGFAISEVDRRKEAIVGGEFHLDEEHYVSRLRRSVEACIRLLRHDRWFSIVFQHWDPRYFATILETGRDLGCTLKAAVTQEPEVIWSMHKKKNRESVIAGEMILTFYKPGMRSPAPRAVTPRSSFGGDAEEILATVLSGLDPNRQAVTEALLFNRMVLEAWRRDALRTLSVSRQEFCDLLRLAGWEYDTRTHQWKKTGESRSSSTLFDMEALRGPAPRHETRRSRRAPAKP